MNQLRSAMFDGDLQTLASIIASGCVDLNSATPPLFDAATYGRVDVIQLLLDAGADVNAVNENGHCPCHAAIFANQYDALRLLVERGANVALLRSAADSLLNAVPSNANDRMVVLLLDAGTPLDNLTQDNLLRLATMSVSVLKSLLARNVDVSALRRSDGFTVSQCVVVFSKCDAVEVLLRALVDLAAVDVNAADARGATALHYAASRFLYNGIRVLVELGADVDRQQADGLTALHCVCGNWKDEGPCAHLLIALGADAHLVNNRGETACHLAANFRNAAAMCACLAAGCDMDQPNNDGNTPRSIIVQQRNVALPSPAGVISARRCIALTRVNFVRRRALQVCIGLQPLNLDALQMCEILLHSCGPLANCVLFHQWWTIATTVKHFHENNSK